MKCLLSNLLVLCLLAGMSGCSEKTTSKTPRDLDMDGVEQAMWQTFMMTRDPLTNTIPNERLEIARQQIPSFSMRTAAALSWQERGPNNIGGRTRAILVDKRDPSGNTAIAGSVSGGIFRTTNFTSLPPNWSPVNDKMLNLAVTVLLQDPATPATMYAGTGEGWLNIDALRGAGIFKSTDGGLSWNRMASTANFEYVQDIAIDRNGNLYAAVRNSTAAGARGIQRSTDGGATWTQVLGAPLAGFATGRAADLEVASNGDVYATLGIFSRTMVMKSSFAANGASTGALNTWINITPAHSSVTQRGELSIAPSNPLRLYLMMQDSATSQVNAVYRSSDAGNTWDSLPPPTPVNNGSSSQTWYNLISVVDSTNPDVLLVGGFHVGRSTDAGANFTDLTPGGSGIHVDQHALVYANGGALLIGNDGGIFYTPNVNAGTPGFFNKNNGYNVTQFYGADFHPTRTDYFLAGAQDNNTQKFLTPGINSTVPVVGGDGGIPHIDQTDGLIQIAATTNNNFYRSLDGGNQFASLPGSNNRGLFINPSAYDDNLKTLYSGDDPGRYYYIANVGVTAPTANAVPLTQIASSRQVSAVKVDPTTPAAIWLGASTETNASGGLVVPVVMKVLNANTTNPTVSVSTLLNVPAGGYISSIDVDANNGNHLLVTLSNYGIVSVFESTDGGTTFNNIEGNLPDMPVYCGIFAPPTAQLNGPSGGNGGILLGTELGVWSTSLVSGTSTQWVTNSTGLPNVRTDMLKLRTSDMLLVAATHGRGLFTTTLTSVSTGVSAVSNTRDFIKFATVNPQQLFIKTGNLGISEMQYRVFGADGRLVRAAHVKYADQNIPVDNLPHGTYILKIYGMKGEQYTWHFVK